MEGVIVVHQNSIEVSRSRTLDSYASRQLPKWTFLVLHKIQYDGPPGLNTALGTLNRRASRKLVILTKSNTPWQPIGILGRRNCRSSELDRSFPESDLGLLLFSAATEVVVPSITQDPILSYQYMCKRTLMCKIFDWTRSLPSRHRFGSNKSQHVK